MPARPLHGTVSAVRLRRVPEVVMAEETKSSSCRPVARTCRRCHTQFTENNARACVFHPESFTGETAQRWLGPGESKGIGGKVLAFWTCCGAETMDASGCCATRHLTYEEEEDTAGRRPSTLQASATT